MGRVEKTVFISYRRTNMPWALAIYQNLTAHGYDVFLDDDTISKNKFTQIILDNIRARAHFLVILTPSALENCDDPNDRLRLEIETALDEKRNIVPLFLEGFDFGSPSIAKHLTGKLADLKKYNGQNVPAGFFDEAMERLRNRFLNVTLDAVLHPVSRTVQEEVQRQQVVAGKTAKVAREELANQEHLESRRGGKQQISRRTDDVKKQGEGFTVEKATSSHKSMKVFLCHASQDKPVVRELYKQLTNDGFDAWLDEENLLPGQDWDLEIEKAVEASNAVIVCLSTNSVNKEGYVQRELRFVLDVALEKPEGTVFLIPIRLDDCQVPRRVRQYHYIDFFPSNSRSQAYKRVKNSLELRAKSL